VPLGREDPAGAALQRTSARGEIGSLPACLTRCNSSAEHTNSPRVPNPRVEPSAAEPGRWARCEACWPVGARWGCQTEWPTAPAHCRRGRNRMPQKPLRGEPCTSFVSLQQNRRMGKAGCSGRFDPLEPCRRFRPFRTVTTVGRRTLQSTGTRSCLAVQIGAPRADPCHDSPQNGEFLEAPITKWKFPNSLSLRVTIPCDCVRDDRRYSLFLGFRSCRLCGPRNDRSRPLAPRSRSCYTVGVCVVCRALNEPRSAK